MARITLLLFCFVLVSWCDGYLIRGRSFDDINTKEIELIKVDGNIIDGDIDDSSPPVIDIFGKKKCAAVGEFCNNHSDCCSNSCLGYMKRCVS
ncbi:hypothetical protein KGM_208287 [Danaus plexippus plexippus]|uniref:Uncharacterized protein n=1 Tax=Danaus plexippus plexippus TaxID=278856 RepID=A0A212F310_DANPL|nr:hypothetical protein KGM_208287 [Danaus plexippus plexippus]